MILKSSNCISISGTKNHNYWRLHKKNKKYVELHDLDWICFFDAWKK